MIAILLSIALAFSAAETDLSGMSFDELIALQEQVNKALWNSDGWQEVTVPVGVYKVGEDIPAGRWTVMNSVDEDTYIWVYKTIKNGELSDYIYSAPLEPKANVILEEGTYVEIQWNAVLFTPYVTAFSFH